MPDELELDEVLVFAGAGLLAVLVFAGAGELFVGAEVVAAGDEPLVDVEDELLPQPAAITAATQVRRSAVHEPA